MIIAGLGLCALGILVFLYVIIHRLGWFDGFFPGLSDKQIPLWRILLSEAILLGSGLLLSKYPFLGVGFFAALLFATYYFRKVVIKKDN